MDAPARLETELARLRPRLLQHARARLHNEAWAEDVVSEAMLAVLEQSAPFAGRAAFSSWVIGILKHKMIDLLRRQKREVSIEAMIDAGEIEDFDDLLERASTLPSTPLPWADPEIVVRQNEFVSALQIRLDELPSTMARAFVMREWLDFETFEICAALSISRGYCNVMMSRARQRLRACLDA